MQLSASSIALFMLLALFCTLPMDSYQDALGQVVTVEKVEDDAASEEFEQVTTEGPTTQTQKPMRSQRYEESFALNE